jgi:hypothetical protein
VLDGPRGVHVLTGHDGSDVILHNIDPQGSELWQQNLGTRLLHQAADIERRSINFLGCFAWLVLKNTVFWYAMQCESCFTDVSGGCIASMIMVERFRALGTTKSATSNSELANYFALTMEAIHSSETTVLTTTWRHIP